MEDIKQQLETIMMDNKDVVDFEEDVEDITYDFDYFVTFENKNAKDKIIDLKLDIESKLDVFAKILVEQIDDQIDEGGAFVTVDFYCEYIGLE